MPTENTDLVKVLRDNASAWATNNVALHGLLLAAASRVEQLESELAWYERDNEQRAAWIAYCQRQQQIADADYGQ